MKNLLLFLLSVLPLSAVAQDVYDTFVVDGKQWNCILSNGNPLYLYRGTYQLRGDTIIQEQKCLKLFYADERVGGQLTYNGAMYEADGKVFYINGKTDTPEMIYDFRAKAGDVCEVMGYPWTVEKVDTIWQEGRGFQRQLLSYMGYSLVNLSGIGCVADPLYVVPTMGPQNQVISCEVNGELIVDNVYNIGMEMLFTTEPEQEEQNFLLSWYKCWTMNYKLVVSEEYGDQRIIQETVLKGDTIINGIHCMQRYERECRQGEEMPETWKEWSYIGQEGSRIYLYDSSTKELNPIMDFGLNVGDVFTLPSDGFDLRVTAVTDTIIASSSDRRHRKCIHLQLDNSDIEADVWVEGIGSLIYGITGMNVMYTGSYPHLEKCVENSSLLYSRSDDVNSISDAPRLNDKGQMINDKRGGVYDLQGRRLTQKPEKGVYIENGRKRVGNWIGL